MMFTTDMFNILENEGMFNLALKICKFLMQKFWLVMNKFQETLAIFNIQ